MLVVKNIEIVNVSGNIVELRHYNPHMSLHEFPRKPTREEMKIPIEIVHGQKFINIDGQEICIGLSKLVQTAIGLPFEVFKNQREEIDVNRITIFQLRGRYANAQELIKRFQSMNFWNRLKFLFSKAI